jgi:hypothetical protein
MAQLHSDDRQLATLTLADSDGTTRAALIQALLPRLQALAERTLRKWPEARSLSESDDLVQSFIAEKLLSRQKLIQLLQPVASGERALWPVISRAFMNLVRSQMRQRRELPGADAVGTGSDELNPPVPLSCETFPDDLGRLERWTERFQRVFPPDTASAPLGAAALLWARLQVARRIAQTDCLKADEGIYHSSVRDMVEVYLPWSAKDAARTFPSSVTLAESWERICRATADRPDLADQDAIVSAIEATVAAWQQWKCRARRALLRDPTVTPDDHALDNSLLRMRQSHKETGA